MSGRRNGRRKTVGIVAGFIGSCILTTILIMTIIQLQNNVFGRAVLETSEMQIRLVGWGICAFLGLVGSIAAISNQFTGGILMLIGGGIPLIVWIYGAIRTGHVSLNSAEDIILPIAILSLFLGGCDVLIYSRFSQKTAQAKSTNAQYCSNCGTKIESDDSFCPRCGERVE